MRKDRLVYPKCECYYEYQGEVCLEDGQLRVKVARCKTTADQRIGGCTSQQVSETVRVLSISHLGLARCSPIM